MLDCDIRHFLDCIHKENYLIENKVILLRGDATEAGCMTDCRISQENGLTRHS